MPKRQEIILDLFFIFYYIINFLRLVGQNMSANGSGIAEGGEIEAQMLNLAPQLAKPFFCLLIYIFQSK